MAVAAAFPVARRSGHGVTSRPGPGTFRWLLMREALVNLLLIAVTVSGVWIGIGVHLAQQRQELERRAERESSNLAQAAAESIGQTIAGVDEALRFLRALYLADPRHFDISAWTSRINQTHGVALEFALIGRDGRMVADSLGPVDAQADFSAQDFFTTQADSATDRLFVSQPIPGHAPGRWSLLFTRQIVGADDWFTGVIVASVDPSWLTRLHRSLDTGRGALMLVGADGRIRAAAVGTAPGSEQGIGKRIDLAALLGTPAAPDRGTSDWVNPVDGTRQLVSFQRLNDGGSVVIVGLDEDETFAPYRRYARQYQLFGSAITLLVLVVGGLLLNNTRRLLVSRQVLRDAVDAISQGIVMVDANGRVPVINRRAAELLRRADGTAGGLLSGPGDGDANRAFEQVRADGTVLEIRTHALSTGRVVRTYTDITERKQAEERILHMALHDSLTGLPNRRMLSSRLAQGLAAARGGEQGPAVLLVDLDRFKNVNDTRGHTFGDRVLLQAAARLRGIVGNDGGLAARIGGDEFCVLHAGPDGPAGAEALAGDIMRQLSEPYRVAGAEILLSVSVGIACYPTGGASVDQLLTNADTALYRAKEGGRATFRLYESAMDASVAERRLLEQDLHNALALGQIAIVYQPILDSGSCQVTGFEALLRWFHPTRGAISPGEFIPIAEECGIVAQLGFWALETACAEAATWRQPIRVSVNLSPKQFWRSDLPDRVGAILAKTGLPAERLVLEVTEGVLIDNRQRAGAAMAALIEQGIRIALDDFGTGYSSLSYLHRFPFESIKIDRSFINTLSEDEHSRAIVRAVLALGRNLRLKVVAEGVETPAQLRWLRTEGCGEVQGYLLGRPMPADAIGDFLASPRRDPASIRVADATG
jgi:diguanylate cyclase (GGDEF)-like protein